jgi:hypothetical protein
VGVDNVDNVDPSEELKRLDGQIRSVTEFAALKPIYARLNEILRGFPDDFEVQFTGTEIRQRLMAQGRLLKQQETAQLYSDAPPEPHTLSAGTPVARSFSSLEAPSPERPPTLPEASKKPTRPSGGRRAFLPALPRSKRNWNRTAVFGATTGLLVVLLFVFLAGYRILTRNRAVPVDIATTPQGASVRVATEHPIPGIHESTCTSNCKLALTPGVYQISASLDGFDPASRAITVVPRKPAAVGLRLQPQAQSLRLLTDLQQGKAVVDDQPPADLQAGELVLDKVPPGTHTVKVTGPNVDASIAFEIADGRLPAVTGPVNARNMIAVVVSSLGKKARLVTNAGSWKLAVNGQPQPDASPAGTGLTSFQPGVNEILLGEGGDQHDISESFGDAPMLTAFLKTDINAGTLTVSTGEDNVRVFLNDKDYGRRTQRGQLRLQTLGPVTVRVAKTGFQDEPPQTIDVKKGADVRVQFDLKPLPRFATLQIQGALAGAEVLIDQREVGKVGLDGSLSLNAIQPGDHTIDLRHDQYQAKRLQRSFQAGRTVVLAGVDVVLPVANGTIRLTRNPASATITYSRGDETESHEARVNQIELSPGIYVFSAKAAGFGETTTRVQLAAGESRELNFVLTRTPPAGPPPVVAAGMAEFEDAQSWKKDGKSWVHKGGGFIAYKLPPKGVFTFTVELLKGGGVFRAGQIRWCVQYLDSKNYLLYEMDRKTFWAGVIEKGKRYERVKASNNLGDLKTFRIQIDVTPERAVQKVRVGDAWKVLDTFTEPGRDFTQGKFGFLIQGNDEIAISDFKFVPK